MRKAASALVAATALVACRGSLPTERANDNAASPGALLPAGGGPSVAASAERPSVARVVDAGASNAAAPVVAGAVNFSSEPRTPATAVAKASLTAAVSANNAFATALFAKLRGQAAGKNLLTSPISATLALTMAYAGATGRTRTEMASAMHFVESGDSSIFEGQNALSQALLARSADALAGVSQGLYPGQAPPLASDYALQIVNSLWGEASYQWQAPFLHTLAADYGASVTLRDFIHQSEAARLEINAWVRAQTAEKINDLIPAGAIDESTRMVLVNALHLKLPWYDQFDAAATAPGPFTSEKGAALKASFMHQQGQMRYMDDERAQIVSLPLAGRQLSVVIALPHAGVSLASYERSLHIGSPALSEPKSSALVALALPKVKFTSQTFSLAAALKDMGLVQGFDAKQAHFEGMCAHPPNDERPYISDVVQKTMLAMQETGIEAAAATAAMLETLALDSNRRRPVPIPMIVNRPYLMTIVDVPTGAVLMLGQIDDPSDVGS